MSRTRALACAKDLSLNPGHYPPKVFDLFEAASVAPTPTGSPFHLEVLHP
jgi:hypothetical protein